MRRPVIGAGGAPGLETPWPRLAPGRYRLFRFGWRLEVPGPGHGIDDSNYSLPIEFAAARLMVGKAYPLAADAGLRLGPPPGVSAGTTVFL